MRYKVLAIRDRAIDAYGQPFYSASVGGAVRSFSDEINNTREGNQLNQHPEDFDLFLLGEFDDNTGEFDITRPAQVAVGKDLLIKGS
jgi:hypothetical protein